MNTQTQDTQDTQAAQATNVKGAKQAKQAQAVQGEAIIPVAQETAPQAASVPFPSILYPRTDSKGEPRKQVPFIRSEGRTVLAKIGGVELSMVVPDTDSIDIRDVVTCSATKVTGAYSVDAMPFSVPAIIFFACGLAGMAERLSTNAESRDAFEAQLQAWSGCYPMPSDERALNARPSFSWAYLLSTYQPTPEQEAGWAALKSKTTTELNALTMSLRANYPWIKEITDAAGYVEPVKKAIPDDLAALLG